MPGCNTREENAADMARDEEERESRNVYSVDMKLCATIYVKASNKKEARVLAREFATQWFEFEGEEISGLPLASPHLPDISLSPAMTGHGLIGKLELAQDNANRRSK